MCQKELQHKCFMVKAFHHPVLLCHRQPFEWCTSQFSFLSCVRGDNMLVEGNFFYPPEHAVRYQFPEKEIVCWKVHYVLSKHSKPNWKSSKDSWLWELMPLARKVALRQNLSLNGQNPFKPRRPEQWISVGGRSVPHEAAGLPVSLGTDLIWYRCK